MRKWNPVYRITVYTQDETVAIMLPLTCKMQITRSILAQNVSANVEIYGLSATTRKAIYQPPFNTWGERRKIITIEAGYGDVNSMYLIFKGVIMQAYSTKQGGGTDVITRIQAQALDLLTAQSSHQFAAGISYNEIIKTCAADMPNCIIGNTGNVEGTIQTPLTLDGNSLEQINKITGGNTFIDNGVINTILGNEVIDVPIPLITDSTGLLETPARSAANLTIKTLFQPDLIIAQLLQIQSGIEPEYDGYYKVLGFTHDLFFSASQDGQRTSTIELWSKGLLQNTPIYVSGDEVQTGFNKVKGDNVSPVSSDIPNNIQEVYEFIQKNGYAPRTKVTNNIYWSELIKANSLKYEKPGLTVLKNLVEISNILQKFHDDKHPSTRINIHSGWRSKGYNSTIKGAAPKSAHIDGKAIDFDFGTSINTNTLRIEIVKWGFTGKKKSYSTWLHIDTRTSTKGIANDW